MQETMVTIYFISEIQGTLISIRTPIFVPKLNNIEQIIKKKNSHNLAFFYK